MNKTPYEVRLDVMQMAKDILDKKLETEQIAYSISATEQTKRVVAKEPAMYSANEVISLADTLYSFVSDNSSTRGKV